MKYKLLAKFNSYLPNRIRKFILNRIVMEEGGQMFSSTLRDHFFTKHDILVGYGSYGGCFSIVNVPPGVVFGNYCSIAKNIKIFRANHPKGKFTTHPILTNPIAGYVKEDLLFRPKLVIGHDVWIGEGAIILPSVTFIGNGAIIGAGSIVTKNVEPYSIIVGNPAKKIGMRFSAEIIEQLEKTEWWGMKRKDLIDNIIILNNITENNSSISKI